MGPLEYALIVIVFVSVIGLSALFCAQRNFSMAILHEIRKTGVALAEVGQVVKSLSLQDELDKDLGMLEGRLADLAAQTASNIDVLRAALMAEQDARKDVCSTLAETQRRLVEELRKRPDTKISAKSRAPKEIAGRAASSRGVSNSTNRKQNSAPRAAQKRA